MVWCSYYIINSFQGKSTKIYLGYIRTVGAAQYYLYLTAINRSTYVRCFWIEVSKTNHIHLVQVPFICHTACIHDVIINCSQCKLRDYLVYTTTSNCCADVKNDNQPCPLSATKLHIGHLTAAAAGTKPFRLSTTVVYTCTRPTTLRTSGAKVLTLLTKIPPLLPIGCGSFSGGSRSNLSTDCSVLCATYYV